MLRQLFDRGTSSFTYLVACERTREAVLIDPLRTQLSRDAALIQFSGLTLRWILDTHVHADHVTGAGELRRQFPAARSAVGEACGAQGYDLGLHDGDRLAFGDETLAVIATPGHTPGHMAFLWRDRVFSGDALLIDGCGRTDFQQGDAGQLYDSITQRLFTLPDNTLVYPGHDYRGQSFSSIAREKYHNARLSGRSREDFIALMAGLNLPLPHLMDVAVPLNLRAGLEDPSSAPR